MPPSEVRLGLRDRLRVLVGRPAQAARRPAAPVVEPARVDGPRLPTLPVHPPRAAVDGEAVAGERRVDLRRGRPAVEAVPAGAPILVVAADGLEAAAFAEVLAARGHAAVRFAAVEEAPCDR